MSALTIDINGLDAVLGKLDTFMPDIEAAARRGLLAVAQIAASDAKLRVAAGGVSATDRGQLLGSIRAEPGSQPLTANVVADVDYAVNLEFGTSTMAPRPFMRPAVDEAARQAPAIIAASIRNAART